MSIQFIWQGILRRQEGKGEGEGEGDGEGEECHQRYLLTLFNKNFMAFACSLLLLTYQIVNSENEMQTEHISHNNKRSFLKV